MPAFSPVSLNTPETITYTASAATVIQFNIDTTNLAGDDAVDCLISDDTTGDDVVFINETLTENTSGDPQACSWFKILEAGDTLKIIIEQTAGTVKSLNYSIKKIIQQ